MTFLYNTSFNFSVCYQIWGGMTPRCLLWIVILSLKEEYSKLYRIITCIWHETFGIFSLYMYMYSILAQHKVSIKNPPQNIWSIKFQALTSSWKNKKNDKFMFSCIVSVVESGISSGLWVNHLARLVECWVCMPEDAGSNPSKGYILSLFT